MSRPGEAASAALERLWMRRNNNREGEYTPAGRSIFIVCRVTGVL